MQHDGIQGVFLECFFFFDAFHGEKSESFGVLGLKNVSVIVSADLLQDFEVVELHDFFDDGEVCCSFLVDGSWSMDVFDILVFLIANES